MTHRSILFLCALLLVAVPGCAPDTDVMHDGYYTAEAASFSGDGWKEYITLYIHNNRIVTAEFNARNASGLAMSWDVLFLSGLKVKTGVHPNELIREYTRELLNRQNAETIRRIGSDARLYNSFTKLAAVAIARAKAGDRTVAAVPLADPGEKR